MRQASCVLLLLAALCTTQDSTGERQTGNGETLVLPAPARKGKLSFEEVLAGRRSVRQFADARLTDPEVSQLLWAAQGMTDAEGYRTAPSAGALYPLEVYVATADGCFHYEPGRHLLHRNSKDDRRKAIYEAALSQDAVREAPAVFVIAAIYERTEGKYGEQRGARYVHMEAGHAAQNLLLQAVAMGLGAVPIGAFQDSRIQEALRLPAEEQPLYLIPVGRPR